MKQLRSILKDLQDSGQEAAIVGHFSIQPCHLQGVTNVNDVRDQPETTHFSTNGNQNPNRYTTEHEQNNPNDRYPVFSVVLSSELLEVIDMWPSLPDSVRAGILAMVEAISK